MTKRDTAGARPLECGVGRQRMKTMQTPKEREAAFRRDLAELLTKHGAELEITDDREPWGMHSGVALVTMGNVWDEAGTLLADYTEFRL